jgi:multidrug efflux pump subunit AcrA (membrane-fusion protein)
MKLLKSIIEDFTTYFSVKTKVGRKHLLVLITAFLVVAIAFKLLSSDKSSENAEIQALTEVEVSSVAELGASSSFDTIGKVEAVSEANLETEAGGRITNVSVKIGDAVSTGQILATIENSSERATLLQAEGAYEAALAASAQSNVGVSEAENALANAQNAAVSVFRSSYNTVNGVIYNSVDTFFSSPTTLIPGLRIGGSGLTKTLVDERVAYQEILPEWQSLSNTIAVTSDLEKELSYAKANVERTIILIDNFITIFGEKDNDDVYVGVGIQEHRTNFTAIRSTLLSTKSSIESAITNLSTAKDAVRRAELAASGGKNSAADAQVKIALGSLQAAQANYQKTIIRTPISGVVNAFYLKAGDYVGAGQPAGIVANNKGLQIKTFVSEIDSTNLNIGDKVTIEGGNSGIITAKAAALDPTNGKVAVVIGVDGDSDLTNGSTVKVTFTQVSTTKETNLTLVPLSALKITPEATYVFTVDEGALKAIEVTRGQLYGENVEIVGGIEKSTEIVTDARGLKEGQKVTVKN